MKKTILSLMAFATVSSAFAGGLLTNTNQNAVFLRNPARDAVIAIDGVYSNPAGIAFLPKGFHLSLSWQSAIQKRQITSNARFYPLNTENNNPEHFFEGKAIAPVIPSFQAAYVFNDKWSVSAQFAVGGGGGKCEFEKGLPMFEQLVGSKLHGAKATSYGLSQNLTGKQYFYGLQVGATYKVTDKISVFGGVRGVLANSSYVGAISNVTANGVAASTYLNGVSDQAATAAQKAATAAQQAAGAGLAADAAKYQAMADAYKDAATTAGQGAYLFKDPLTLDCSQSGLGITPILGVDVNLGKLNLAAKYEFRTTINLKNKSVNSENLAELATVEESVKSFADGQRVRSDIPALLTLGAQYSILDNVRVMGGFHYFFDKDAEGSATDVEKNTWEVTLGAEWDVNNWLTVSAGTQRTKYGFGQNMQDTNFNVSSTALCLGATFHVSKMVNINAGYMHSFYNDHTIKDNNGITNIYTRKNDAVGVSVDLKF